MGAEADEPLVLGRLEVQADQSRSNVTLIHVFSRSKNTAPYIVRSIAMQRIKVIVKL
jgi:hypothetical protein